MNPPHSAPRRTAFTARDYPLQLRGVSSRSDEAASAPFRWETGPVWEEAGIAPPFRARLVVELLHRLAMGEVASVVRLARSLARVPGDDPRCRVADPALLGLAARDFGIVTAGRTDEAIARDVADAVIDEYAAMPPTFDYRSTIP